LEIKNSNYLYMDKLSYALGLGIAQNLKSMGVAKIDATDFANALDDVLNNNEPAISHKEAQKIVNAFFAEIELTMNAKAQEQGIEFLEKNGKRAEVTTTASGLQYEILVEGHGKKATATDKVKCHYEGTLVNGTIFDSSIKRDAPATFGVTQVIPGWVEALQMMPEGSKWKLYIPSELGYGAHGAGEMIPPHSALIFEIELLKVL